MIRAGPGLSGPSWDWIRNNTDCAAVLAVPAPVVHPTQYLRGFADWYMDFIRNPKLVDSVFRRGV